MGRDGLYPTCPAPPILESAVGAREERPHFSAAPHTAATTSRLGARSDVGPVDVACLRRLSRSDPIVAVRSRLRVLAAPRLLEVVK